MISVVICTKNRSNSLLRTLTSLAQLSPPEHMPWEIVVVDNGSTDETKTTILSFIETTNLDSRYIFEPNKGKCYALNTGMREARGDIVAFTDDDVLVDKEWLVNIAAECVNDPNTVMYFGQTRVARPDLPRLSIREGDSGVTYRFPCDPSAPGCGNNMILRKGILASVEGFDTDLGPGTKLRSADDIDFTYRVLRSGGLVRYCPNILAYHDHDRLSPKAVRGLLFDYGIARGGYYCKHILKRDLWATKLLYWEIKWFLRQLLKGDANCVILHLSGIIEGFTIRIIQTLSAVARLNRSRGQGTPLFSKQNHHIDAL